MVYLARGALPPFILALALVYLFHPPVTWLEKKGLSRTQAILAVYGIAVTLGTAFLILLLPQFLSQINLAVAQIPGYVFSLGRWAAGWQQRFDNGWLPGVFQAALDDALLTAQGAVVSGARNVVQSILHAAPLVASLFLAPFLAFFFLRDLESIKDWWHRILPFRVGGEVRATLAEMDAAVGGFFRGQVLVAMTVGLLVAGAMYLLGMPFPLLLGLVAGITDLIPYFGPVLGGIPAVLLASLRGPLVVAEVVVALAAIQQVESGLLAPRIIGSRTGLHPLIVAGAVLAGGCLFGFAGAILAVPLAGALRPLLRLAYRRLTA
ncbi:MAG TPA: AI-2E family transporter [Firmicutes bacterium]|nr:AI-2E family transporter [Bacillota bacterium]